MKLLHFPDDRPLWWVTFCFNNTLVIIQFHSFTFSHSTSISRLFFCFCKRSFSPPQRPWSVCRSNKLDGEEMTWVEDGWATDWAGPSLNRKPAIVPGKERDILEKKHRWSHCLDLTPGTAAARNYGVTCWAADSAPRPRINEFLPNMTVLAGCVHVNCLFRGGRSLSTCSFCLSGISLWIIQVVWSFMSRGCLITRCNTISGFNPLQGLWASQCAASHGPM